MEQAIAGHPELMKPELTEDVMKMMTRIRKDWGLTYPEEEHATENLRSIPDAVLRQAP